MKQFFWMMCTCLCLACSEAEASDGDLDYKKPDSPIQPWDMQALLGHGFDVQWAEFPQKIAAYGEDEVQAMAEMGFRTARIRTGLPADEYLFEALDRCIDHCLKHGLIPVLAYNALAYEDEASEENLQASVDWWTTVADRYRDYPHRLLFNLNIEWSGDTGRDQACIDRFYEAVTPAIRSTNPTRILIYSPARLSSPEYFDDMRIPDSAGPYVMAEWHLYAAGPSKNPNSRKYWSVGTEEEKQSIRDIVAQGVAWQEKHRIPTWVGAWMPGNYNKGNDFTVEEQVVFARFMIETLDAHRIPWAVNSLDKFYDVERDTWRDEMRPLVETLR
ncbi:MAG: glycoside hydrolase family 5 protein [Bacteroidaceae bacterium]